jgi:hypothetical protein
MEITLTYIWSQILTVVEYGLLGATYFAKKRKVVVIFDTLSMAAGILAYILLGGGFRTGDVGGDFVGKFLLYLG